MTRVLVTAFEPYGRWKENASWLALVELTRSLPTAPRVTTRRYPVSFSDVRSMLADDLAADYDYALHLGQSPGSALVRLEAIAVNMGGASSQPPEQFQPLVDDGPVAYRSELPLADWAVDLKQAGIPAEVSYHAGTFLCNATMYLSHHLACQQRLKTRVAFVHLPLDPSQVEGSAAETPALPAHVSAAAVRFLLGRLDGAGLPPKQE